MEGVMNLGPSELKRVCQAAKNGGGKVVVKSITISKSGFANAAIVVDGRSITSEFLARTTEMALDVIGLSGNNLEK